MASEGEFPKTDGDVLYASEINNIIDDAITLTIYNKIRQDIGGSVDVSNSQDDIFSEAYIDADGRYNTVQESALEFDTNKYLVPDLSTAPYIIIEADAIISEGVPTGNTSPFNDNDCILGQIDDGKWVLYSTVGTDAEKRAKMYATLFAGRRTGASNSGRQAALYIENCTALKTSVTRDVGKRGYFFDFYEIGSSGSSDINVVGTFSNTSTNDDCSVWTQVGQDDTDYDGASTVNGDTTFEFPTGTSVNFISVGNDSADDNDEIGTDLSADEDDNPATCKIIFDNQFSGGSAGPWRPFCNGIMLLEGTVAWVGATPVVEVDYTADSGLPEFTASTSAPTGFILKHSINSTDYSVTPSKLMGKAFYEDWETGATTKHKLSEVSGGGNFTMLTGEVWTVPSTSTTVDMTVMSPRLYGSIMTSVSADIKVNNTNSSNVANLRCTFVYSDGTGNATVLSSSVANTAYTTATCTNPNPSALLDYVEIQLRRTGSYSSSDNAMTFWGYLENITSSSVTTTGTLTTDWISEAAQTSFTAFTIKPVFYYVKVEPKTSAPTANYPSLKGAGVYFI